MMVAGPKGPALPLIPLLLYPLHYRQLGETIRIVFT
jgi:hypothetical protein